MLTAGRGPRACHSCRSQLLSLFEHGFSNPTPLPQLLKSRHFQPRPRLLQVRDPHRRTFSATRARFYQDTGPAHVQGEDRNMEDIVRHARQTFGETLPKDFLSTEEYVLYERLYGPPVRETRGGDFEVLGGDVVDAEDNGRGRNVLQRENGEDEFEEVDIDPSYEDGVGLAFREIKAVEAGDRGMLDEVRVDGMEVMEKQSEEQLHDVVHVQTKSQREVDAILRLQRDIGAVVARPADEEEDIDEEFEEDEEVEREEEEDEYDEDGPDAYLTGDSIRTHPHTIAGRFGTSPSTLQLPRQEFVLPITELLSRTNNKHLTEAAERAFGGPGLPYSSSTPASKKLLPQKHIGLEAGQHNMSEVEADAYLAAVMPAVYASIMSTLTEVRKRLGSSWIRDLLSREGGEGPRVLDAGAGGAGVIAWREVLTAEWDVLCSEGLVRGHSAAREGKSTVLTGPSTLRHRMSRFLENTTFLPRLPDYLHSADPETLLDGAPAEGRKSYDLIIAPHTLLPLKEDFRRKNMVQNLWSLLDPNGGVLILIEKGLPRGFEAIAGARAFLLKNHISSPSSTHVQTSLDSPIQEQFVAKENGMIIAPCTNHTQCPMYKIEGLSAGRKDFCHFGQRFERPGFLQKVLGATKRNHEDVKFSYFAVRRGVDLCQSPHTSKIASTTDSRSGLSSNAPIVRGEAATEAAFAGYEELNGHSAVYTDSTADSIPVGQSTAPEFSTFSLPRAILPALKRRGHVTLDLCTPSGTLERWTVPKSFSRQAYRDARKVRHGDLWALGAKTRTPREPRLGKRSEGGKLVVGKSEKGIKGLGKGVGKNKKNKKDVFEVVIGEKGMEGIRELRGRVPQRDQKRTKRGRVERRTGLERAEDDF